MNKNYFVPIISLIAIILSVYLAQQAECSRHDGRRSRERRHSRDREHGKKHKHDHHHHHDHQHHHNSHNHIQQNHNTDSKLLDKTRNPSPNPVVPSVAHEKREFNPIVNIYILEKLS